MSDEAAFLRAAQAQPDDDTIRLVYADWLDEQGRASQAQFVRLQVRRSQLDVFDPDRAALLAEESRLLQKHKRYWNGRVHRELHRRGLTGLVDARRGQVRTWDYHRGMVGRVVVTADGLAAHHDVVSALGPVRVLGLTNWREWSAAEQRELAPLAAGVEVLDIRDVFMPRSRRLVLSVFQDVPVLDLRRSSFVANVLPALRTATASGELPAVVLFRQTRITQRLVNGYSYRVAETAAHVLDPHHKWDALRLRFADLTGELPDPVRA